MRRGVFDILRRAFDNAAANWQLSLLRFVEVFVLMIVFVVVAVATALTAIGISLADFDSVEDIAKVLEGLEGQWVVLAVIFGALAVMLLIMVAAHAFIEAGCARVMVDAERAAGPALEGPRQRYRTFTLARFFAGGAGGWWRVFWIYNAAWGLGGLLLLIPLLPVAGTMWALRGNDGAVAAAGCLGLLLFFFFAFVVMIVIGMWSERAVVEWAAYDRGIAAALSTGWRAVRRDFARHGGVLLAIIVLMFSGSMFFSSFSYFGTFAGSMNETNPFAIMFMPLQLVSSTLSTAFSAFVTSWFLAAFASLAVEGEG